MEVKWPGKIKYFAEKLGIFRFGKFLYFLWKLRNRLENQRNFTKIFEIKKKIK